MHVICIMVSSVDGKTTKWFDQHLWQWTSKEDQDHFTKLIDEATCIIMGRKTYEVVKDQLKHKPGRLRIILTNNPEQFNNVTIPNQLEFTNDPPLKLLKKLKSLKVKQALLVGGSNVNTAFFKENLVNELWLTLEPKLFGKGNNLVAEAELNVNLELMSVEKLNPQGTLLLHYIVT